MNKKFLSAILFGALMVSSTGTFVSCKDYDDDIDQINQKLDGVEATVADLQKKIGDGAFVKSITPTADGFTVTMSDGSSTTITGISKAMRVKPVKMVLNGQSLMAIGLATVKKPQ